MKVVRRYLYTIAGTLLLVVSMVLIGYALLQNMNSTGLGGLTETQQYVQEIGPIATGIRILLIIIINILWTNIGGVISNSKKWSEERTIIFIKQKWRITCWLVLLELIIGQNIIGLALL